MKRNETGHDEQYAQAMAELEAEQKRIEEE